MAILSLQSSVAYGHVGNAAAVFALRRLGREVWPVDTVAFSHHPGHGPPGGRVRPADEVADIIDGLDRLGALAQSGAVLSGYLGAADTGRVVLDAVRRVKAYVPAALYACDPVMGDRGPGLYVPEDVVRFFADLAVPAADILVPNHFELEMLAGRTLPRLSDVLAFARALCTRGPRLVVVTSLAVRETPPGRLETLAVGADTAWRVVTPRLELKAHGAGDLFAALFLSHVLAGRAPPHALTAAVSSVFAVIDATVAADAPELRLVEAQATLTAPQRAFAAEAVA